MTRPPFEDVAHVIGKRLVLGPSGRATVAQWAEYTRALEAAVRAADAMFVRGGVSDEDCAYEQARAALPEKLG